MTPSTRLLLVTGLVVGLSSLACQGVAGENGAVASASGAAAKPAPAPQRKPVPLVAAPTAPATAPATTASGKPLLVLKDGTEVALGEAPVVALGRVIYTTPDGIKHAIAQDLVDQQRTQLRPPAPPPGIDAAAQPPARPEPARMGVPDFEGVRPDGSKVKLSELKGKVVLVDFWATWCMPCMMEMPNVKATYAKLGGKDFEIMGVSLDNERGRLDAYVKDQGIKWPQYFDGKGWGNAVSRAWGVNSIPYAVLLDREGKIAKAGLRGGQLEIEVAALLGK